MLTAWALSFWLCDSPATSEYRPLPVEHFETLSGCLARERALLDNPAIAPSMHCRLTRVIQQARARQQAARQPPASLRCPGDQVVWVNTRTRVYHFDGSRWFGNTAVGRFMCRKQADREGDRVTETE